MNSSENGMAFGAPGMEPRWTRSTKEGLGTAYHTGCRVWFTLSHGIINELYYPNVDCQIPGIFSSSSPTAKPSATKNAGILDHKIENPEKGTLYYRLVNSEPGGRYRITRRSSPIPIRRCS